MSPKTIHFKTANKGTVALAYNISPRTFTKWVKPIQKEIGEYIGGSYSPKQIGIIVNHLGFPEQVDLLCV